MLHLWASGGVRVFSLSTRSQTTARKDQTVLHCLQHTGEPLVVRVARNVSPACRHISPSVTHVLIINLIMTF